VAAPSICPHRTASGGKYRFAARLSKIKNVGLFSTSQKAVALTLAGIWILPTDYCSQYRASGLTPTPVRPFHGLELSPWFHPGPDSQCRLFQTFTWNVFVVRITASALSAFATITALYKSTYLLIYLLAFTLNNLRSPHLAFRYTRCIYSLYTQLNELSNYHVGSLWTRWTPRKMCIGNHSFNVFYEFNEHWYGTTRVLYHRNFTALAFLHLLLPMRKLVILGNRLRIVIMWFFVLYWSAVMWSLKEL